MVCGFWCVFVEKNPDFHVYSCFWGFLLVVVWELVKMRRFLEHLLFFSFLFFLSKGFELMDAIRDICSLEFCFGGFIRVFSWGLWVLLLGLSFGVLGGFWVVLGDFSNVPDYFLTVF